MPRNPHAAHVLSRGCAGILWIAVFSIAVPTRAEARTVRAQPLSSEDVIVVDGRLDEPPWDAAEVAGSFTERLPHPGHVPPVDTTFRILYSQHAIYLGIELSLAPGERPRGIERTRDSEGIWSDDAVSVKIDPRRDRRTTIGFVVNAAGAQLDYLALDNGLVVRREFDAVWDSAVAIEDDRWVVELRIPAAAIGAADASGERILGLQVTRDHNARAASYDWAPMSPEFGAFSALHYGTVMGLAELGAGPTLVTIPYALLETTFDQIDRALSFRSSAGLDTQLRLGADVWLEATLLTDFSEVDLDDPLVNLDRFPLFFPERRTFFVNGLDVFDFGVAEQVQPLYTRRIGLDRDGARVPVLGGVKLYGRESGWSFGILEVLTASTPSIDAANYIASRVRYAPGGGASYVGAIVVSRQPLPIDGPLREPGAGPHATVGADGLLRVLQDRLELYGFAAVTSREGAPLAPVESGEGVAADARARYLGEWLQAELEFLWVEGSFAPDVGFVRRRDASRTSLDTTWVARPSGFGLRAMRLYLGGELQTTAQFDQWLYMKGYVDIEVESDEGWLAGIGGDYIEDTVLEPFEIVPGVEIPAGTYRGANLDCWLESPSARNPYFEGYYAINNAYFGGLLHNGYLRVSANLDGVFQLSGWADVYYVELPEIPGFWTYGINALLRATPTTTLQIDLGGRLNEESRSATALFRVRWRFAPGSDLWLVHRTDADFAGALLELRHTTTLKLTWRFDQTL